MNRCGQPRPGGRPCTFPARLNGACLAHQPPRHGNHADPGQPTIADRVTARIAELGQLHPRKTPIAVTAQAWREIGAEQLARINGSRPA